MDKKELISLVGKYLNGKASTEERAFIEAWYREMDSSQPIETILTAPEMEQLEQKIFVNIQARIRVNPQITPQTILQPVFAESPVRSLPTNRRLYPSLRYIAAAALLFIIAGSYILYRHLHEDEANYATLSTQPGKVSKITLDDGSIVWLNAASRLKFSKAFGRSGPREVFLEGEAYFEVAKDQQHPFLVHTQALTTRVLGTKFNVNAYADVRDIEITLLEGKVMLSAPADAASGRKEDTLYLSPNQKALFAGNRLHRTYNDLEAGHSGKDGKDALPSTPASATGTPAIDPAGSLILKTDDHADEAVAWRDGQLIFRNTTLESVMSTLSRKYNIRIQSDSNLLDQSVTTTITPGLSAEDALLEVTRQLKRTGKRAYRPHGDPVQYRKEGSVYYIE